MEGFAICIKQSENFLVERLRNWERNDIETICTQITPRNGNKFLLFTTYIPPNKTNELKSLLELVESAKESGNNIILTGDFNAKSKLWGNTSENAAGNDLELYLRHGHSVILNDGLPTRRNSDSVIDLVLVTSPLVKNIMKCQTLSHENVRSDHIAIFINFDDNSSSDTDTYTYKYQLHKTDWSLWDTTTNEEFSNWISLQTDGIPIDDQYQTFLETFQLCIDQCVPKVKSRVNCRRRTPPWMTEEVKLAKNELNAAKKHFKRRQTPQLLQELKIKEEEYDTICDDAKTRWVEETCTTIDTCIKPKDKWRAFHKLTTYEEPDGGVILPILDENKKPVFDHNEKCKLLQKTFFGGEHLKDEEFDKEFKRNIEDEYINIKEVRSNTQKEDFLNREILYSEVEAAIQKLENGKASGPDEVFSDLIKKSNNTLMKAITILFNNSFENGQLPKIWKIAKVKFIQKPGKDSYYLPGSYRPISLTSILGKCFERIINSRLYAFAEHYELFDKEQEGFREKRGTTHALLRLTQDIMEGFKDEKTTAAIFIDLEKAFDSVWREGLLVKLHRLGINGKIWTWIQNFLEDREAVCCIRNFTSQAVTTTMGLPQGSVLSPLLFNLYLRDILAEVSNEKVKFADDGTIWKTDTCIKMLEKELQKDLEAISTWTKKWRMKLNTEKTEYCLFSKDTADDLNLTMKGKQLKRVKETKLLGVTLDERLTFKSHIQKTVSKTSKALGLLAKVGKTEKVTPESMLKLYKSLVVPHLEYAAPVWHTSPHVGQLEKMQRQGLCICLGAVGTASCESLEVQSNILPLDLRREEISIRECSKIMAKQSNSLIKATMSKCQDEINTYSKVVTPMFNMLQLVRDMESVTEMDTKCLEAEFSYLEYMQPSRHRPTYWNNLGSSKSRSSAQETKAKEKIQEIIEDLPESTIIAFTDGSCRGNPGPCGAGACLYLPNEECLELKQPVSKLASILVGELVAIKITLEAVMDEQKKRRINGVEILSDSQTAVGTLTLGWDCKAHSMLIQEIKLLWEQLEHKNVSIRLDWTPGHAQIQGNEKADKLAKEAAVEAESMDKDASQPVSQSDIKKAAHNMALYKWQRRWEVSEKGRQLHMYRKEVGKKNLDFKDCIFQRILLQLQNGHCKLKDHLYTVGLAESAGCECGMAETIEHYLLECPLQELHRDRLLNNISLGTDLARQDITVQSLLSTEVVKLEKIHRQLINRELDDFIKSSGRF